MNAYCKSRYSKKTSTVIGHKGLLKVRRFVWDETTEPAKETEQASGKKAKVTGASVNIRTGPGTKYTAIHVAKKGEKYNVPDTDGWLPIEYGGHVYWISAKYTELEG